MFGDKQFGGVATGEGFSVGDAGGGVDAGGERKKRLFKLLAGMFGGGAEGTLGGGDMMPSPAAIPSYQPVGMQPGQGGMIGGMGGGDEMSARRRIMRRNLYAME